VEKTENIMGQRTCE